MEENHQREQYFFNAATIDALADLLERYPTPCTLCAPMVGQELARRRHAVRVLDVDERFGNVAGFRRWDIYRPTHLGEAYDVLLCDPPFFNVSLSQLFRALRLLCAFDLERKVMLSYLVRREDALLATFAPFKLVPTGCYPAYQTVQACARNDIQFYANFAVPEEIVSRLAAS